MLNRKDFKSNFELNIAKDLTKRGILWTYEKEKFEYTLPIKGRCKECGCDKVVEIHHYTPDWKIGNMYIESKGRFPPTDQKKMIAVKKQYPEMDIRMLFMVNNKFPGKKNRYASGWCRDHGFMFDFERVPKEWLDGVTIRQ